MKRSSDDSGQIAPLLAVMLLGLLVMVGLVIDAGLLLTARRDLQGIADGAARAGAMAIDIARLRASGGREVSIDPGAAHSEAESYLSEIGYGGKVRITSSGEEVSVQLQEQRRTVLMGIAGIRYVEVRASSTARPKSGISEEES